MSEISARPWGIAHTRDATDSYRRYIEDAKGKRIAAMYHKDFCDYATCMPDAEHIIKCVNEHDALVAEVKRLKHENDVRNVRITELFLTNEELFIENKQLKNQNERYHKVICGFEGSLFKKAEQIEQLKAEVELWQKKYKISDDIRFTFEQQNEQLKAENEKLKDSLAVMIDIVKSNNPSLNLDNFIKLTENT